MRNHYVLRLTDLSGFETSHEFICTRRQIDKVFYSLAFASCNSTIQCGSLYIVYKPTLTDIAERLVNTFTCKGVTYVP